MKQTKQVSFTLGPWKVGIDRSDAVFTLLNNDSRPIEQNVLANAKLMAAAPELLEALQAMVRADQSEARLSPSAATALKCLVERAIAKATGGAE